MRQGTEINLLQTGMSKFRLTPVASHIAAYGAGSLVFPIVFIGGSAISEFGMPLAAFLMGVIYFILAKPVRALFKEFFPGQRICAVSFSLGVLTFPYSGIFTAYQIMPAMLIYFGVNRLIKLFDLRYLENSTTIEIGEDERFKQGLNVALFGGASALSMQMMLSNVGNPLVLKIIAVFFGLAALYALCLSVVKREPTNCENFYFTESQAQVIRLIAVTSATITLISGLIFLSHASIG